MATRIALISGDYRPALSGVAHYTQRLAEGLAAAGASPVIVAGRPATGGQPGQPGEPAAGAVPVLRAIPGWGPAALPGLLRALAGLRPDVVHIQYVPASFGHSRAIALTPPLLRALVAPTVVTLHEYGGWEVALRGVPGGLVARLARAGEALGWWDREAVFLAARSDRVIVSNAAHRDLLASRLRKLDGRLRLVPVGPNVRVAPDAAAPGRIRDALGMRAGDPLLSFFGYVHPAKGVETLLRALALLRPRLPGVRLLVVGGFESLALPGAAAARYREAVHDLIARLGLADRVVVTGYLPEEAVSARLQASDLCVLPFNNGVNLKSGSLSAALSHGLPTVVTDGQDRAPGLVHGEHVWKVPARQPAALAAAIEEVLGNPGLRDRLQRGALAVAAGFDWGWIVQQHLALYAGVAARHT